MKRDAVFWFPWADPYYRDRFNALAARGSVSFEVWYSMLRQSGRSWDLAPASMVYPHRFIPYVGAGQYRTGVPVVEWASARPRIMISYHGHPPVAGSVVQHLRPHGKLIYYVETTFPTWVKRSGVKETLKHILLTLADGFLSPGPDADQFIRRYALPATPIYRLNHVVHYEHFLQAVRLRESEAFRARRRDMCLDGFVFLNVGQMAAHKGIDTLLQAFAAIERSGYMASLLLVGDGADRERYKVEAREMGLSRVRFLDFVQQPEIPQVYALADAFVFATRGDPYGLVVDEAMASGLPVISTTSAGEITARVRPTQTGLLVPPDDTSALRDAMVALLSNESEVRRMGQEASRTQAGRTPESWARQMESIIADILTKP